MGLPVEPLVKSQIAGSSRCVSALVNRSDAAAQASAKETWRPGSADHDQVAQVGERVAQRIDLREDRLVDHGDAAARVLEVVERSPLRGARG